jgi:hypothetical protein
MQRFVCTVTCLRNGLLDFTNKQKGARRPQLSGKDVQLPRSWVAEWAEQQLGKDAAPLLSTLWA